MGCLVCSFVVVGRSVWFVLLCLVLVFAWLGCLYVLRLIVWLPYVVGFGFCGGFGYCDFGLLYSVFMLVIGAVFGFTVGCLFGFLVVV